MAAKNIDNKKQSIARAAVKDSLIEQLKRQRKTAPFYISLVDDYMKFWDLKKKLGDDIKKNGLRYEVINGNGIASEKANESVTNLQKTTTIMLKILSDLNLQEPAEEPTQVTDGYL